MPISLLKRAIRAPITFIREGVKTGPERRREINAELPDLRRKKERLETLSPRPDEEIRQISLRIQKLENDLDLLNKFPGYQKE